MGRLLLVIKKKLLVETLVKVHSSEKLSDNAKCCREEALAENPGKSNYCSEENLKSGS